VSLREIDDVNRGDSYVTPPSLIRTRWPLNDFDPCPLNTRPDFNGLSVEWPSKGFTFANIPYSAPERWTDKAISEKREDHDSILLMRTDNSTEWFDKCFNNSVVHLINNRIAFKPNSSANFASMIAVFDRSKPFEHGVYPYLLNLRGRSI